MSTEKPATGDGRRGLNCINLKKGIASTEGVINLFQKVRLGSIVTNVHADPRALSGLGEKVSNILLHRDPAIDFIIRRRKRLQMSNHTC